MVEPRKRKMYRRFTFAHQKQEYIHMEMQLVDKTDFKGRSVFYKSKIPTISKVVS